MNYTEHKAIQQLVFSTLAQCVANAKQSDTDNEFIVNLYLYSHCIHIEVCYNEKWYAADIYPNELHPIEVS